MRVSVDWGKPWSVGEEASADKVSFELTNYLNKHKYRASSERWPSNHVANEGRTFLEQASTQYSQEKTAETCGEQMGGLLQAMFRECRKRGFSLMECQESIYAIFLYGGLLVRALHFRQERIHEDWMEALEEWPIEFDP